MATTPLNPMLSELRELIKKEARVKGSDNLDDFIDSLVNEILCNYAMAKRYFEFLVVNQSVTTTLNNGSYSLPARLIALKSVRYKETNSSYIRTINPRPSYIENANGQIPKWYDVAGTNLEIFPYDNVPAGDTLLLDYWQYPATLTASTVFPIPRLVNPVKMDCIKRVLIFNKDLQEAEAFRAEAANLANTTRKPLNDG